MKCEAACPLAQVDSCRNVPEHDDPTDWNGAPFRAGYVLDGRSRLTEVLSRSGMAYPRFRPTSPARLGRGEGWIRVSGRGRALCLRRSC